MSSYKDWLGYQKAYKLAMDVFEVSKKFPVEERYSLTDQLRRASRSVCANLGEAFGRRKYPDYFLSKLNDAETENTETAIWLQFAHDCKYITTLQFSDLLYRNTEVGKLIWYMKHNPQKFR